MKCFCLAAQVLVLGFIGSTFAAPFQNGSFEIGTLTADPCNVALPVASTAITGWTVVSGNIDYVTPTCWQPSHGTRSLDLVGTGSVGGVQQTFDTIPGQAYEVIFDLAGNPSSNFPPQIKNLTVTVDGTPHNFTFNTQNSTVAVMGWTAHSFQFVAAGSSSTISFVSNMTPSTFAGAALDNVRMLAITPTVVTTAATGITAASATLNGTVSSNGTATTVTFQYGPTLDYGFTWSAVQSPLAPQASNAAVSATLAGLQCNTTYHFRVVGANGAGSTPGADASFTTATCPARSIVLGRDLNQPQALVFLTTVRGSAPTGTVRFTDTLEPAAMAACSAVALSGSGDARSAACQTLFNVAGTHRITATYSGDSANAPGISNTFEQPVGYAGAVTIVDLNQHGLTGSWYEPATSGQGLAVEVFPDQSPGHGQAFASWFTFDPAAGGAERQRWYTLQGPMVSGASTAALTIYQNSGGNFNAPPATTAQAVGAASLSFDSCSSGELAYNFSDGSGRSGTIPLTRLLPNVTCSLAAPFPTHADFALSGSWYGGAATSGQGFTAEFAPSANAFFLSWFTYMPNGASAGPAGQRWYTAQGAFTLGLRTIPVKIYETTGGSFDIATPPGQRTVEVGSGTMTFQSCSAATFSYTFTGGSSNGLSGTIALGRVGPMPPGCTP